MGSAGRQRGGGGTQRAEDGELRTVAEAVAVFVFVVVVVTKDSRVKIK